jgi:LysM repeat protein
MRNWFRASRASRASLGPLVLAGWTAILVLLPAHPARVGAVEGLQTTPESPSTNAYEQELSREAAVFRPSAIAEEGAHNSDRRQSADPPSMSSGTEPGRIERIKAFVDEALATSEEDQKPEGTSGAEPPQVDLDPVGDRRKKLKALVTEPMEPASAQDASYLNELRDEVSETVVFGEAKPAELSGDAAAGATTPESTPGTYRVKPGDSLWKIAENQYGDGYQWKRIYDANRDSLRNIDILRVGQVLRLSGP